MEISYSLTSVSNNLFDWLDRSSTQNLGYYDFQPYFVSTSFSLPKEIKTQNYVADYPKSAYYITDKGDHILQFATTGFTRKELKLEIKDDILFIRGEKENTHKDDSIKEMYNYIAQRKFKIAYQLSEKLDSDKITTSYENGLLEVIIPLSEESQKKNRTIEI
jgi:HSP20 family molecular chaperone IbpA